MKVRTGTTGLFGWEAPEPVAADPSPALVISAAGEALAGIPALDPVVAPQTVTAVSDDNKRLTLDGALADADRAAGERWGEGWFITASDGVFPVRIGGISTADGVTTIRLADPLPRRPAVGTGTLQWSRWTSVLSPAAVTGTARRDITWTVTWQPLQAGAAADDATEQVDEGRLIVCRRPFDTGLTPAYLGRTFPDLAQTVASRDNGRLGVIEATLEELEIELAPHLAPKGLYPDDINGRRLRIAHAYLAAALIVEKNEPNRAKRLRQTYPEKFDKGLRQIWVDQNRNGQVDEGEDTDGPTQPVQLAGARLSDLFPTTHTAPTAPRYPRGRPR